MRRFILELFFRIAASGWLPGRWFAEAVPAPLAFPDRDGPLELEIVTHCWNYSALLAYQLSSVVLYPPTKLNLRMTVFHSPEDSSTGRVLAFFAGYQLPKVTWNWWPLDKTRLFRRAIGRNQAALATRADWIWFTDCDQVFHQGCLDALAEVLPRQRVPMVYPRQVGCSAPIEAGDPLFRVLGEQPRVIDIDVSRFSPETRDRAVGALQIVRGDVARALGYCNQIRFYQEPLDRWQKCYEDRTFRWLLGTPGSPIEVPGLYRLEHTRKGRRRVFRAPSTLSHP